MGSTPFTKAVWLIIIASTLLAGMDSLAKVLISDFSPLQVTWARFTFHALILFLLFFVQGERKVLRSKAPKIQIVRGLCMAGVSTCLYISLRTVSLAEATAIMYLAPIIVTLLAGTLLGEKVTRIHYLAVAVGFIGVLMIIRPGFDSMELGLVLALISACLLSVYFILTRKVASIDSANTSLLFTAVVGAAVISLAMPWVWTMPSMGQWLALVCMGGLGAMGHFLFIKAYSMQPASELSPWLNAQVIAATAFSVLWFKDDLDIYFLCGTTLIIGAGLILWLTGRNRRAAMVAGEEES